MACIQKSKKNTHCANPAINDPTFPGYCKYHVNRFKDGKDTPNPVIVAELQVEEVDLPGLPPLPVIDGDIVEGINQNIPLNIPQIPRLNAMPVAFDFNERQFQEDIIEEFNDQTIDNRINNYINNNRNEIIRRILPNMNLQQKDDILIEMVMVTPEEERGFLIANYERLFDLVLNLIMPVPRRLNFENIQNNPPAGLINMVLAALGFGEAPANPGIVQDPVRVANNLNQGPRGLREFFQDEQNVHTKELVEPVIENAKKLIKLAQKRSLSQDTFKEIIYQCELSGDARKQLCLMYYSNEKIYNLKAPTYRLVLDGIWSYVTKQKEDVKKDILERMSQELEDNIGMCAQGNLSRIINILSGFMDDLKQEYKESIQDKMAKISKIENKETRLKKAKEALKKDKIPEDQWEAWLEAME